MSRAIQKRNRDTGQFEYADEHNILKLEWDTAVTDTSMNSWSIRLNDADYSAATEAYVGHTDPVSHLSHGELLLDAHNGGTILFSAIDSEWRSIFFRIDGDVVDNGTYITIPISFIDESTETDNFRDEEPISTTIFPAPASGTSSEFEDDVFRINDDGDNTKQIAFQASNITTSTVRTITMPDANVNLGAFMLHTVTKTHTDFQTAATLNTIEIYESAAGEKIYDVIQVPTVAFAGTGITAQTSEVGLTGDLGGYATAFDVMQIVDQQDNDNADLQSWTATTSVKGTMRSTGADLDQSTAGSITYYIVTRKFL